MKAWTDYPIVELGDTEGVEAPIKEVDVVSYDGDKYCRVRVSGITIQVKSGYLYQSKGRYGDVQCLTKEQLNEMNT